MIWNKSIVFCTEFSFCSVFSFIVTLLPGDNRGAWLKPTEPFNWDSWNNWRFRYDYLDKLIVGVYLGNRKFYRCNGNCVLKTKSSTTKWDFKSCISRSAVFFLWIFGGASWKIKKKALVFFLGSIIPKINVKFVYFGS